MGPRIVPFLFVYIYFPVRIKLSCCKLADSQMHYSEFPLQAAVTLHYPSHFAYSLHVYTSPLHCLSPICCPRKHVVSIKWCRHSFGSSLLSLPSRACVCVYTLGCAASLGALRAARFCACRVGGLVVSTEPWSIITLTNQRGICRAELPEGHRGVFSHTLRHTLHGPFRANAMPLEEAAWAPNLEKKYQWRSLRSSNNFWFPPIHAIIFSRGLFSLKYEMYKNHTHRLNFCPPFSALAIHKDYIESDN